MSDYEKAMADRAERIDALRKRIAGTLPEELIGGFSLNGLTLEIGCGHGHFLASYGAAFPQENCIGIDLISSAIPAFSAARQMITAISSLVIHSPTPKTLSL